ncbi:Agenet domain-containing protein [Carex littledalei]|uniref:Agenet domain-containing protein n=1 Tax=Carex littledalei TaxID=544730 RepID=A0A833R1H8_9POAL|nr:Agenet domain-containing protein [Carex littledalei]
MASDSDKWMMNDMKKLVVGQHVEVLSLETGIQGCWHSGMVIDTKPLQRIVKYEYLFQSDHPQSPNLVEPVPVSPAIDGILHVSFSQLLNSELDEDSLQTSKRNNIRPCACRLPIQPSEATYGMCVDACKENVHWEGIILDHSNSHSAQTIQRTVFFPDLDMEESVSLQNLSLSSDWNEITGEWTTRGRWKFLEALEANLERASLCKTMQQLWDIAKSHPCFVSKISAWTRGTRDEWSCSRAGNLNQILKEKSDIARSHLKSVGWQFMETEGGAKYYVSAEGARYNSFIKACEEYLAGKAGLPYQETAICAVVTGGMSENKKTKGPYGPTSTWNPVNLIPEFSSVLTQGAKYEDVMRDTVRKHLLHLGWIVKYRRDTNRPMTRYRYHSPKGKTYYSLREVFDEFATGFHSWRDDCNRDDQSGPNGHDPNLGTPEENGENPVLTESVLIDNILPENLSGKIKEQLGHMQINCGKLETNKLTGEIQSSPNGDCIHFQLPTGNEGNQLGLNRDLVTNVIQPEYPPETIRKYIECIEDRKRSNQQGYIAPSNVKSDAKRHLLSAGWTLCIKSTRRVYYRSPSGKSFNSLLQACKAYLMEPFPASGDATTIIQERNVAGETSGSSTSVMMKYGSNDPKREH